VVDQSIEYWALAVFAAARSTSPANRNFNVVFMVKNVFIPQEPT
jgi:hypothetical protein